MIPSQTCCTIQPQIHHRPHHQNVSPTSFSHPQHPLPPFSRPHRPTPHSRTHPRTPTTTTPLPAPDPHPTRIRRRRPPIPRPQPPLPGRFRSADSRDNLSPSTIDCEPMTLKAPNARPPRPIISESRPQRPSIPRCHACRPFQQPPSHPTISHPPARRCEHRRECPPTKACSTPVPRASSIYAARPRRQAPPRSRPDPLCAPCTRPPRR